MNPDQSSLAADDGLRLASNGAYKRVERIFLMPTIVDDLRAIAASPVGYSKAEVVEILLAAADQIETSRIERARATSGVRFGRKILGDTPSAA